MRGHLIHFEPQTLKYTLSRAGFTVEGERRFLPEYGSSGWVQSSLNRVLPHTNFLYELVKDRDSAEQDPERDADRRRDGASRTRQTLRAHAGRVRRSRPLGLRDGGCRDRGSGGAGYR